jgi:hypothetical protein
MQNTPTVPAPSSSPVPASPPADTARVKTEGKKRRRTADPVDREAKARERTLRNRAAAQLSREKKRRYVEELESANFQLKFDNTSLTSRLSSVESENHGLTRKLEAVTLQLNAMQNQMSFLASLASCRNNAATQPLAQPSSPASSSTPVLCSDTGSDTDSDRKVDKASWNGDEKLSVDFGESAALTKLARERRANSLQRKLTASFSCPSWPTHSAHPILPASPLACKNAKTRCLFPCFSPRAVANNDSLKPDSGRISKRVWRRTNRQPDTTKRPCRISRWIARLTFSLVLWTLSSLSNLCSRQTTMTKPHGTARRLSTSTPMPFCPATSSCSTPRPPPPLLPLPRRFLPYFENCDQSMDRDLFRRMVVKWIQEARFKLFGGGTRNSSDSYPCR